MEGYITIGIIILCTLVEITPIKINPISMFGKLLNKNLMKEIDNLKLENAEITKTIDKNDIDAVRSRILANDALLIKGEIFTQDQWNCLYKDIKKWDMYHEKYKDLNGILKMTIEHIDKCYKEQHYGKK